MNKRIWLALSSCLFVGAAIAQTTVDHPYNTGIQNIVVPSGDTVFYYDSGGESSDYYGFTSFYYSIVTFSPALPGQKIKVQFTSFSTEDNYDALFIYNGNEAETPDLTNTFISTPLPNQFNSSLPQGATFREGGFMGSALPGILVSTAASGALTFQFQSDAALNLPGWSAIVTSECFSSGSNDIGVASIDSLIFLCPGNHPVYVTVQNFGDNQVDTFTLEWEFDGVAQPPVHWNAGVLDTCGGAGPITAPVLLGIKTLAAGGTHAVKVWTSQPNGSPDPVNSNDTLQATVAPALGGIYTLGGSSPDYPSFSAAVNAMVTQGICDTVIFNVRNGTYNEQVTIPEIPGADSLRPVIFRSESGDSSLVILTFESTGFDPNYTLRLNGADWLTFSRMTMEATGTDFGRVVEITGGANHNRFLNNRFLGVSTSSAYDHMTLVGSPYSAFNEFNVFKNNHFLNGSYGLSSWVNYNGNHARGLEVRDNIFENQYWMGISTNKQSHPIISGNLISGGAGSGFYGIEIVDVQDGLELTFNQIKGIASVGSTGISASNMNGSPSATCLIANNFVQLGGTDLTYGMNLTSDDEYHHILFNTIRISNTNPSSCAFFDNSAMDKQLKNNILSNTGGGMAISVSSGSLLSDHNNFQVTGGMLGRIGTGNYADLASWQAGTGQDGNSLAVNPLFLLPDDFHTSAIELNGAAQASPLVVSDLDGQPRNVSMPDIGADEFNPAALDASLVAFASPVLPFAPGVQDVKVTLKNNGMTTLSSATIGWKLNGASQTPVSWTGSLVSGQSDTLSLGTTTFNPGVAYDLQAFSSQPNGVADENPANDTLLLDNFYTALAGVYTIGGTSPDFADFTSAVAALHLQGVADSVIFNVRNGAYLEQVTIHQIMGAGSARPVIFQSESGDSTQVVLSFEATSSADNYTLRLAGADWLRFHQLSIQATGSTFSRVLEIKQLANNNVVSNCRLEGPPTTSTSPSMALVFQDDYSQNEFNVFENNRLLNGSMGMSLSGFFDTRYTQGLQVKGNIFENQYIHAVQLFSFETPLISNNAITSSSVHPSYSAISVNYCLGINIIGNKLSGLDNVGAGIKIANVDGTATQPGLIANNFVQIGGSSLNTTGISTSNCSYQHFLYNTVHITNTDFSSQAVKMVGGSNNVLNNNIFACTGGGIAIQYGPPGIAASDFNDFYTSGTVLCNLDGNNLGSLYGWQNATGFDANSLALDPAFDSVGHYVVNEPVLNGYAQPSSLVAYDIEGTFRSATAPDLGVLEFSSPLNEAALLSFASPTVPFAAGTQSVQVNLRNNGASPIGSAILQWQVNGVSQPAVVWTGNLAGGATAAVSLGTYNFNLGTSYELKAWLSLPNGLADPYPANDTTILENLTSGLAGVYTIGGSSPDFANFSTAVEALHFRGVVGAVAFNVRPGNYLEQITINRIPGADSLKTVTFQSESGDSSQVVLRASGSFANNHVLRLNGTDWVNFRKMTIEQLSALFGQCITIQGGCHHVSFTSNHIKTVGPDHSGIYINDDANYRLVIRNNDFLMGYAGLYALGSASQPIQGLVVEDNLFRDQNNTGLYLYYATDPLVRGNEVRNSQYGIYVEASSAGAEITGNHIYNIALTGIVLSALAGTPTDPALVANNFVQAEGTSTAFGIWVNNGSNLEIAFNSVNMTSVLPSSTAFYNAGGSAKRVQNNIFANSGGGYAYYNDTPASIDLSDHNDLYTTGYFLGFWNGFHANLADWVATTQLDSHSLSVNPAFVSATDLHTTLPALNDAGKPIPSVLTDFDGDARDPAMPDIGADEFPISNEDAGLTAIDQPAKPFPAGLQPVLVSVFNNGLDTLETVTIHWEVNGAPQAPFNWSGSLLSGETADSVNIGSFIFSLSNSYDIRAWTSLPNGLADTINHNDTTELLDLYPALGGFYTIGGSAPDFPDFAQAVLALTLGGVVDSVVFNVRAGTYQEQLSIPEITGASLSHSIAFQSESGDSTAVILTFNNNSDPAANYTLLLDGADFLRFRRLTLQGDGNFSRLAELRNGADKNRFEYCRFLAANTNHELVYSAENSVNDNFNAFNHNYFSQGSLGIHLSGNGSKETGTVVAYNVFKDQAYTAVYLNNQSGAQVLSNEISTVQPSNFNGIYIDQCQDNIKVLKNNVGPVPLGVGIYLNNCQSSPGQEALVANNFVYVGSGNTISLGISINGGARFRIYHNNVHNASNNASTYSFYNNLGNFVEARNNVFASSGAGHAVGIIGGGSFVSDFNDLFSTGGAHLGYWEGTPAANLGEWQSASGQDMHSISADPLFASPSDLHVSETDLNRAGMPLAQVSDDFDGDPRDPVSPDIGADEFAPMAYNDAGVVDILQPNDNVPFAAGLRTVTAVVKNNGLDTINSLTVQWRVNNILQTPYSWSGTLLPGEPDTVDIGTYFFPVGLPHAILAYTQNPDGAADTTNFNDTTLVAGLWAGLGGAYTIGGSLPDFADFSAAVNALNEGGVVAAVTFNVRGGVYNEQIEVHPIKGSSLANAVAFQSESLDSADVRLTAAYGNLVSLNGADHLSFRHLTLEKTDWGHVVSISNGSNNVGFFDNHILSTDPVSSYDLINSGNSLDNNTVIARNRLRGGKTAVSLSGQGASSTYLESGTIIEDNDLSGCSQGISLSYQNAPLVQRNAVSSSSLGIELVHSRNLFRVLNNKVTVSGAGASSGYGLLIADSEGTSGNRGLVANNFVHVDGTGPSHGMYINGGVYANYHFNNVNISNTNPSSRAFFSFAGSNKQLLNNVLANSGGGYAVSADGGGGLLSADYNDLYATGPYLGSWNGTIAPDLPTYRALSGRESNSLSVNPLFFSDTDLHVLQTQLDSAAFVVTGITQDIDGQPRNATHPDIGADEIAFLPDDLGVSMLVSPASACTLSGSEAVTVKVQNYSSSPLTGFSVAYSVNGGAPVVQSAGSLSVPAGGTANFTFSTPVNMATTGLYEVSAWTVFAPDTNEVNDTLFATVNHTGAPGLVNNMIPVDGADDLPVNVTFSWSPASASSKYDLYIWNASGTQPLLPTAPNITQISYFFSGSNFFSYGQTYKWRVVAKNNFCSTPGPVQQFTILNLPDFSVPEVTAPVSAFSGQSIGINWQVKNTGSGSTAMNTWIDAVFLSSDMFFDPNTDVNLGTATNFSALDVMESYSNTASFTLPNGISGNYYIFVVADYYDYLTEASENNNSKISAALPVTLTPPPDLFVPLIIPPGNAFSGTPVTINITVKNQGLGETRSGNWVDRVWLSPDPGALSTTNATLLGTRPFSGTLGVNATYTFNLTEMLPQGISGTYYIYVQTDANSEEYEQANETNNTSRSPAFNIFLTPPPDLQVTAASAPASGSNREVVTLSWTVENLGGSVAPAGWFDRVFISPNPALTDFTSAVQLGSFISTASLQPGASYTQTKTLNLPDSITGDYYFYVLTDAYDNVFEHTFNNNNSLRVSNATAVLTPNLAVSGIQVLNAANSGDTLQLSWRVKNTGPGKLLTGSWSDRVYISTSSSYSGNPTQVGSLAATNLTLLPGDSISRSATVILPNGISGQYHLFVFTDGGLQVYENNLESNNVNQPGLSLPVTLSPYPDLVPVNFTGATAGQAGGAVPVSYVVRNMGTGAAQGLSWKDKVYLSNSSSFNPTNAALLRIEGSSQTVPKDSSYSRSFHVNLPSSLNTGTYYFFVEADQENQVYEHTQEGNNRLAGNPIAVTGHPQVDLSVTAAQGPATANSGETISVSWTVSNLAGVPTIVTGWEDGIFLSTDQQFDAGTDILLGTRQQGGPLSAGASYSASKSVSLPNGISGTYYLIVRTDRNSKNNDSNPGNNHKVGTNGVGAVQPIVIILAPSPNLAIANFTLPPQCFAGQQVEAHWTIQNIGNGGTAGQSWTDKFYLSTDLVLDNADLLVGSRVNTSSLLNGSGYTDTIELTIPVSQVGNRILILKTDANDAVYEHNGENNNTATASTLVILPPPSDLVAMNVSAPAMAAAGEEVMVTWKLKNQGANPAVGAMKEAVFFSDDNTWDVNDALLATLSDNVDLSPGETQSRSLLADLRGVEEGSYFVVVRTDILDNIFEGNNANNTSVSTYPVNVVIQELPFNVATPAVLYDNRQLYYRIETDGLDGETMLVTLTGDSLNGINELYLRHEMSPTRAVHDYSHDTPFSGNQQLLVPALAGGTYYLMAYGSSSVADQQNITLLAEILEFEILSVNGNQGGNNGYATIQVRGSKFDSTMSVILERFGNAVPPVSVHYVNPTLVFATFDLRNRPLGLYDVTAIKTNGETATLDDGFTIVPGSDSKLATNLIYPPNSRVNNIVPVTVEYQNTGDTDLLNPVVRLISLSGAPVAFSPDDLVLGLTELEIPLSESNAPPGLLRPGAAGNVTVYAKATAALEFLILLPDLD